MYIWSDKIDDIRISFNDVYMIILMTGWMLLFMNIFKIGNSAILGIILIILGLFFIRSQTGITEKQYYRGMIPHHSMAIHMTKKLLQNNQNIDKDKISFLKNIISTQEKEIKQMKSWL
jgi:membrane-bound ClpP family serine protease